MATKKRVLSVEQQLKADYEAWINNKNAIAKAEADAKIAQQQAKQEEQQRKAQVLAQQQKRDAQVRGFMSGRRNVPGGKGLHYAQIGGVGFGVGDLGVHRGNLYIHNQYYNKVASKLGITPQQAQQASNLGREQQSGKASNKMIKQFQGTWAEYAESAKQRKRNVAVSQRVASLKSNPPNPNEAVLRVTSSDPEIARANAEQTAYVASLRAGGVGIATALLNPRTTQTFFKNGKQVSKSETSINTEQFFKERGYDLSKPELIPNSIFKPEKQLKARAQAKSAVKNNLVMGDLNLKANKYEKTSKAVLEKRNQIRDSFGFEMIPIQNPKLNASQGLEYFGPTDKRKIENFKLMETRPLNLAGFNDMFGTDMKTGEVKKLKTYGQTVSPEMQFFGEFVIGSRNTFDSYGNMLTNTGNFLQGKPQQPMARPPVQDQFFGAVIDSAKNTFEGPSENRASDPMGEFFGTQQKRIDKRGFGQVAGELTTEALFWALPVGAVAKIPKIATSFLSPTVKTVKASDNFIPGKDFMKLEGKTKDVSWGDQIGAFFGHKGNKVKSQSFTSSNVPLGKGTTKGKGKKGNNFFSGSSGTGKKPGNFFDEPPKTTKTDTGLELIVKTQQKTKKGNPPKKFSYDDFLKYRQKYANKAIQLQKQKAIPKTKAKQKQDQFFKVSSKQKQLKKSKQQFFKPIPLITPKAKQKQKVKQSEQFFKPIPKLTPKLTPKLKQKDKQKYPTTGVIMPYFPPTAKSTGMFLPPLPFFRQGGRRNRLANRKRPARKSYTAWNVNTKQVGSFLKGSTYKKSRSTNVFDDLDKRTKKAKKEKDYDYLDFF